VGRLRNLAVRLGGYDRRTVGFMPLWVLYEEITDGCGAKNDDNDEYEDVI